MANIRLTEYARDFIEQAIKAGDSVIDATAGNGHDTLFLAENVGQGGTVYAFDVQEKAIQNVRLRLEQAGQLQQLKLVHAGHQTMSQHIPGFIHGKITAVMFNLGYLPGADHQLTTQADSTLEALDLSCTLLAPDGKLSIIAYPGHQNGKLETQRVQQWASALHHTAFTLKIIHSAPTNPLSPVWLGIIKR